MDDEGDGGVSSATTKRWVEAVAELARDRDARVLCPVCRKAPLTVLDVAFGEGAPGFERHMSCDVCGAYEAARMGASKAE